MQKLNTTTVYILAVLGFLCCCCNGIGVIFAAIGFFIAHQGVKNWQANPDAYSNGPQMKTARTVALVALILSGLAAAYTLYGYATKSKEQRDSESIELMRDLGVPDDMIDKVEENM